jgi:hypothetical protein
MLDIDSECIVSTYIQLRLFPKRKIRRLTICYPNERFSSKCRRSSLSLVNFALDLRINFALFHHTFIHDWFRCQLSIRHRSAVPQWHNSSESRCPLPPCAYIVQSPLHDQPCASPTTFEKLSALKLLDLIEAQLGAFARKKSTSKSTTMSYGTGQPSSRPSRLPRTPNDLINAQLAFSKAVEQIS